MVADSNQRRLAILRHISRYGVTLRPVLDRLFFDGRDGGSRDDLRSLVHDKLIRVVENAVSEDAAPQVHYSYYFLAPAGARRTGASAYVTRKPGGQALARNLAFLWFCCVHRPRRHRLLEGDLVDLFGPAHVYDERDGEPPILRLKGYHCLDRQSDRFRILQVYAPKTSLEDALVELRKRVREARQLNVVAEAMERRQYGFAVLTDSIAQRDAFREALAQSFLDEQVPFLVARSPGRWKV